MKRILFTVFLCCITFWAFAFSPLIQWRGYRDSLNIADKVFILEDNDSSFTIDQVASPGFDKLFVPSGQNVLDFSNSSFYWLKFTLQNDGVETLLLEMAQPAMSKVDFYSWDSLTGKWKVLRAGFKVQLEQKLFRHQYQLFPLKKNVHEYYIRFQSLGQAVPVRIWKEELYDLKISKQRIIFGIFTGLMMFVVLINLFFFFSLRRFAYLHYATLVFLYYLIAANVEGYILYLFPGADLIYGYNVYAIFAFPVGITYVMFFLETQKYTPRIYKAGWIIFIYYCSYLIWHRYLTPLALLYVTHATGLSIVLLMSFISIQTGRKGNKMGYYYFVCYMVFFVIAIIDSISRLTGSPPILFEISYISIGFLAEAFMFSYLLTKRFDWEKKAVELEKARTNQLLLEQTIENERIVREQNIILERNVKERTLELTMEKRKSDDLLLNILPAEVAEELKATGTSKAKSYGSVSVLFTDFKDFTLLSEDQDAEKLVHELDHCFRAFDRIIKKHNLEKIKTIGDAYMCAGGLPNINNTHAMDSVNAGLEICAFMKNLKEERSRLNETCFEVRVGISSGPVIAGIVGSDKFVYDIWGDTVNMAARMEQSSESGKVNVSGSTFEMIRNDFDIEYRGKIEAKNKGSIDMYFVNRSFSEG